MESKPPLRRSRRPSQQTVEAGETDEPPPRSLHIQRDTASSGRLVLHLTGVLDLETVGAFRDAAFTAIGSRPAALIVDTRLLEPLDISGIEALNTICRVATMVHVHFAIWVGPAERETFDKTGLNRLIEIETGE